MATIATTTNVTPFVYPGTTLLDRDPTTGYLYCMIKASVADTYTIYRSTNGGTSWASYLSVVRTGVVEIGSIFVHDDGFLFWAYRTNESSQDRIYHRRCNLNTAVWEAELLVASASNGGVAGAVYNGGMDLTVVKTGTGYFWIPIGVAMVSGATVGVQMNGVLMDAGTGGAVVHNVMFNTWRQWLSTSTGRQSPSVDLEHTGNAKGSGTPHLWVAFGRTRIEMLRFSWNGGGWNTPAATVLINASVTAMDAQSARWDGSRFLIPVPTASTVVVYERNQANSTTTVRTTPTHPTGVVRNCSISYSATSGDFRVYAVGTSTTVLYYVDFIRATGLWSAWTAVLATAVLGATGNNYGVRRSSDGDARYTVYTAHAASSTISTTQGLSYAPHTPTWTTAGLPYVNGGAADVGTTLVLDWVFTDPDVTDTQGWFAVSRQIGAGALAYWRASDSTWQVAEVQNAGSSTTITLPAGWGVDGAAAHAYKVKVWDAPGAASGYSAALTVIPSAKVNPVLTSPVDASTITSGTVTVTWTAAEQTQYRATLASAAVDLFTRVTASGWGTSTSGSAWTNSGGAGSDFSTNGTVGQMSLGSVNSSRRQVIAGDALAADVLVSCSVPVVATGAAILMAITLRTLDAANDHYRVQVSFGLAGALAVSIIKRVAATDTTIAGPVTMTGTYAGGTLVKIRARVEGSTIYGKGWLAASAEPESWQVQVTDTSFVDAGPVGLRSTLAVGNTNALPVVATWDHLVRQDLAYAWDSGWVTDSVTRSVVPTTALPDLTYWVAAITTRNNDGLASLTVPAWFTTDFVEPPVPTLVAEPMPAAGYIRVTITNPTPGGAEPALAYSDLYRRVVGTTGDGVRIATGLVSGAVHNDWWAVSGVNYEYRDQAFGVNGTNIYSAWTA